MSKVLALRGISGSGKSTYAEDLRREGWAIVSRDAIRETVFRDYQSVDEDVVTKIQDASLNALLAAGRNTVIDDTNIRLKYLRRFAELTYNHAVPFEVKQFDCDVNTAIFRVQARVALGGRDVPEGVIRKQAQALKSSPLDWEKIIPPKNTFEHYEPPALGIPAILVDVDGTLALNDGHRGWYDYEKVINDKVKHEIARLVRLYHNDGFKVIVMSGRDDNCQRETAQWLKANDIPYNSIFMRRTGDQRQDSIVKIELFNTFVRDNHRIEVVLDDRNQVVDAWRSIGLTCLQVAPGDF